MRKLISLDNAWLSVLKRLLDIGDRVDPRGLPSYELPQQTVVIDQRSPVLRHRERKLSYQFMAAEAFWILSGDDRVAGIAPWNKNIAQFSDDGERFFGAYGPPFVDQVGYVVDKLRQDPRSRQAGLTIWRPKPGVTRDTPCTIALFFHVRGTKLRTHVYMRSSDAWLGLPYDLFNFSMMGHYVAAKLNNRSLDSPVIEPGRLYLTMASSHLYERNADGARDCLRYPPPDPCPQTPPSYFTNPKALLGSLEALRDTKRGDERRWWEER